MVRYDSKPARVDLHCFFRIIYQAIEEQKARERQAIKNAERTELCNMLADVQAQEQEEKELEKARLAAAERAVELTAQIEEQTREREAMLREAARATSERDKELVRQEAEALSNKVAEQQADLDKILGDKAKRDASAEESAKAREMALLMAAENKKLKSEKKKQKVSHRYRNSSNNSGFLRISNGLMAFIGDGRCPIENGGEVC